MMRVSDVMTRNVASCSRDTQLQEVAKLMQKYDCGALPVTEDDGTAIGIITDRDIVMRTFADGRDPNKAVAGDCMTPGCLTVKPHDEIESCCRIMEENQVRRVIVEDENGRCAGIVSQADIATHSSFRKAGEVVARVSSVDHGPLRRTNGMSRGTVVASALMASSLVGAGAWLARKRGIMGSSHLFRG